MAGYFDSWGYKYKDTKGKGVVRQVVPEWDVYGYVQVYTKVLGKKHSKSERFYLGRLYGWTTTRTIDTYNTVRLVRSVKGAQDLFSVSEDPLGGKKEVLG